MKMSFWRASVGMSFDLCGVRRAVQDGRCRTGVSDGLSSLSRRLIARVGANFLGRVGIVNGRF